MTTYFTVWHYIFTIVITLSLITATLLTLLQRNLRFKGSIIFVYFLSAAGLLFIAILMIDNSTKHPTLMNIDHHRFLPKEKIIFTGRIRNSGDYTIGEVNVEIKLINKDTGVRSKNPTYQSNAFAELLGDKGLEKKPSFTIHTEVVATNLKPGQIKKFWIAMPYPPYFKGHSEDVKVYGR
ncbi:MAG: DUF2393 family protein [Campylobacterales bacterium]|nr:DUF2393 family protein [Campylobacterales bacterium]